MEDQSKIADLAVAAWRLEKWLDNVNVERKMAAKSALRAIKKYLQGNDIETEDLTGAKFDVGLAVSVVNNESDETDEEKLIISEMVKPIVKEKGAVIQYGQVILGDTIKQPKENPGIAETQIDEALTLASSIEGQTRSETSVTDEQEVEDGTNTEESYREACSDSAEEEKEKAGKKQRPMLLGVSMFAMQIVTLGLLIFALTRVNVLYSRQTDGRYQDIYTETNTESKTESTTESNTIDTEGMVVENSLTALSDQVEMIEEKTDDLAVRLTSVDSSLAEIAAYVALRQEEESENADQGEGQGQDQESVIRYIVQDGDTLISICEDNDIDYYAYREDIMTLNQMTDPDSIISGQEILLPLE